MRLLPAIDLMSGEVVRLTQGKADSKTRYHADPVSQAADFRSSGATHLHVVDLDAAFRQGDNRAVIAHLVGESGLKVEVGGGLRDLDGVAVLLDAGVWRVIVGSAAIEDPRFVEAAVARFGAERVVVGIDAKNGVVRIKGWTEGVGRSASDVGCDMAALGVSTLVYTDIARDGMLGAPDVDGAVELARVTGCRVVVSGGVSSGSHIAAIARHPERARIDGIIVGKALYEGRLDVAEALSILEEAEPC